MKFFEHQALVVTTISAEDGERLMLQFEEPLPRVILVSDKLLHEWDLEAPSLEELGYKAYEKDHLMRATYYARRPWVWLLKAGLWAERTWFRVVYWGYGKLWYLSSLDGTRFRLSKLRLGTGAMARSRTEAAGLTLQIESQYHEISKLKMEKSVSYNAGQARGWDQHAQVVEQFLDERVKDVVQKSID